MNFAKLLEEKFVQAGYNLSQLQINQFTMYYEQLMETNKKMNLTAIVEPEEVITKHFIDSLAVFNDKYFTDKSSLCDLGTGAGFPGIPLKIYKPNLKITLMDSLAKRLGFLDNVIESLDLKGIQTCHLRAEDAGHNVKHREKYDIVVARAVASLNILAEYCLPLVKTKGIFIAMKGRNWEQETVTAKGALQKLQAKIVETKSFYLPELLDERAIIFIKKESSTAKIYPRKAGTPERQPLL